MLELTQEGLGCSDFVYAMLQEISDNFPIAEVRQALFHNVVVHLSDKIFIVLTDGSLGLGTNVLGFRNVLGVIIDSPIKVPGISVKIYKFDISNPEFNPERIIWLIRGWLTVHSEI